MKLLRKKRVFALLLLGFVFLLFSNGLFIGQMIYPIHYREEIRQNAVQYQVDPFLIAAIIKVETNFNHDRESKKGAVGIMQLMPDTAEWIRETSNTKSADFRDPKHNIQLGSWYLAWLNKQYKGNWLYSIAAYNAGQGNVSKWKNNGVWDGTEETINKIPFGETRHYVQRVLYYQQKFKKLYGEEWSQNAGSK
ncbi:lytic transglycosylase domain-containing protein [Paenibacillus chitinolyticus]|uniref:lytic transglycosylase domain-containing protein n=1 Tax=Paenibacillus chitinolyticus TaxID=79263 RepID=UPI002DB98ADA|nr:lytic transglycosylase domain-containing protein [Paenibacillus chitinolyticus]MEC0248991.1 lytic transglycosylase domain-containing protein [Paenibacillus chitinolyticus]